MYSLSEVHFTTIFWHYLSGQKINTQSNYVWFIWNLLGFEVPGWHGLRRILLWGSKPSGCKRFSLLHTCLDWPRGPPTLFAIGSVGGCFLGMMWLSVVLTTHRCLVPRLRMNGYILLWQWWHVMGWSLPLLDWTYGTCMLYLLGTFAKLRKAAVSFILSVRSHGTILSVEKINTIFMFVYVFLQIVLFCERMWENVEADGPHMIM